MWICNDSMVFHELCNACICARSSSHVGVHTFPLQASSIEPIYYHFSYSVHKHPSTLPEFELYVCLSLTMHAHNMMLLMWGDDVWWLPRPTYSWRPAAWSSSTAIIYIMQLYAEIVSVRLCNLIQYVCIIYLFYTK